MKQPVRLTLIALAMTTVIGCSQDSSPQSTNSVDPKVTVVDNSKVLATVNGTNITQKVYDDFVAQIDLQQGIAQEQVITELVTRTLVLQDAEKRGLQNSDEFIRALNGARENLLLRSALEQVGTEPPLSDEELKKAYDQQVAAVTAKEYKARHILVDDEAKAKAVIAKLEKGADFAELAKSDSTGPSGATGGDLGWFSPEQMVPSFSEAVMAMEKGSFTREPVQTQFGYHVILLEDSRNQSPPDFEQVKGQLSQSLQQQRVRDYLEGLRTGATIEMKVETEKKAEESDSKS